MLLLALFVFVVLPKILQKVQGKIPDSLHVKSVKTKEEFDAHLKTAGLKVVDFYADWCGPCRAIAPHIDALAEVEKVRITACSIAFLLICLVCSPSPS